MTTKQIKDVKSNTQTQITQQKEVITMTKQDKQILNKVMYDTSQQIKFNIQKRYMKLSYLDTRKQDHYDLAMDTIKSLSDKDKAVLRRYTEIIDQMATDIGQTLKDNWKQQQANKPKESKTVNTAPAKEDVSIINLHFNNYIIVLDRASGIVRTITDTGNGNQVTKCKVNSHWIYVARPLNPTLLDKVKTLLK